MFAFADICDFLGNLFLIAFIFILFYAVCSSIVSDQTLFDRTLLPSTNPNRIQYFIEPQTTEAPQLFPTVFDEPEVYVSFVVPAYNEEKRIPSMLNETLTYLESRRDSDPTFSFYNLLL